RGLAVVGIGSGGVEPEALRREKEEAGYPFPYLYDEAGAVARAFHAACAPDFYLFDADRVLAYRGQVDAGRPGNGVPVTGQPLRAAIDAVLEGRPVTVEQAPSLGCALEPADAGNPVG